MCWDWIVDRLRQLSSSFGQRKKMLGRGILHRVFISLDAVTRGCWVHLYLVRKFWFMARGCRGSDGHSVIATMSHWERNAASPSVHSLLPELKEEFLCPPTAKQRWKESEDNGFMPRPSQIALLRQLIELSSAQRIRWTFHPKKKIKVNQMKYMFPLLRSKKNIQYSSAFICRCFYCWSIFMNALKIDVTQHTDTQHNLWRQKMNKNDRNQHSFIHSFSTLYALSIFRWK